MAMLTQKSQVTMPKKIRNVLGIGPGDEIEYITVKGKIVLSKKKNSIFDKYKGILGASKTADIIDELR